MTQDGKHPFRCCSGLSHVSFRDFTRLTRWPPTAQEPPLAKLLDVTSQIGGNHCDVPDAWRSPQSLKAPVVLVFLFLQGNIFVSYIGWDQPTKGAAQSKSIDTRMNYEDVQHVLWFQHGSKLCYSTIEAFSFQNEMQMGLGDLHGHKD